MTVFKGRVIFVGIITLIIVLIASQISETGSSHDKRKFIYDDLKSITLYDRGLLGDRIIRIVDPKKVKILGDLIRDSKELENGKMSLKSNQGFCEIEMEFKNEKSSIMKFIDTGSNGYILDSGSIHYGSDSLGIIIIEILKKSN